jgi:DNA-binding response OmpR family regulator
MNILLIDDDSFTRKVVSYNLLESGYNVTTAANGEEAVKQVENGTHFDIVMLDLLMPQLSGPSFLLRVKRSFREHPPTIIIVSGLHNGEDFLHKLGTEYDHFIPKPIDFR